jgi:hypothetical protein
MNRKIGMVSAIINICAVAGFALCMLSGFLFGAYLTSIFIAWSFVIMLCTFTYYSDDSSRVAGFCAVAFGVMYAVCNSIVYFTQLTTVRVDKLSDQATILLDFQKFGLFFSYDMLGYCFMAISTLFVGMTIDVKTKSDKALKYLLMIHGVFAIGCFIMPMLGVFNRNMQGADWIGTAILEFWCAYFVPVGVLSFIHFKRTTPCIAKSIEIVK